MGEVKLLEELVNIMPCSYGYELGKHQLSAKVAKVSNVSADGLLIKDFEERSFSEKKLKNLLVTDGDLLVVKSSGSKANILSGKTAYCTTEEEGKIVASNFLLRLTPNKKIVFPRYLWYILNSQISKRFVRTIIGATTYPNLKWSLYRKHPIPLPPLPEQQRIATILDHADAIRCKNSEILEKYKQLAQSVFLEMFGDPVINEMKWTKARFETIVGDDCPLTYGIVQPGDDNESGVSVVRPVDLTKKYITVKNLKRINRSISDSYKRTILKGNELLLSVRGSVGLMSFSTNELKGANVTRGIVPVWMNEKKATNLFIYGLFNNERFRDIIKGLAKGATLIQLNLKDLRELEVLLPPLYLQARYSEIIMKIETQILRSQESLEKSEELFQSLLQRAFKGEP